MLVRIYFERNHVENTIMTQCITDNETRYFYPESSCFFGGGFFGVSLDSRDYEDENGERIFSFDNDEFVARVTKLIAENPDFIENFSSLNEFGREDERFRNKELDDIDYELNYDSEGSPKSTGEFYEWTLIREFETDEEF